MPHLVTDAVYPAEYGLDEIKQERQNVNQNPEQHRTRVSVLRIIACYYLTVQYPPEGAEIALYLPAQPRYPPCDPRDVVLYDQRVEEVLGEHELLHVVAKVQQCPGELLPTAVCVSRYGVPILVGRGEYRTDDIQCSLNGGSASRSSRADETTYCVT